MGTTGESSDVAAVGAIDSSVSITRADSQGTLTKDTRERLGSKSSTGETPVVMARKDATYQGSLHNIPLFNEDPDEYHQQVITTNDPVASASVGVKPKKSFFAQVAEQIDLKLLRDGAFALFAVSNFFTSLGFNIPFNFANALAVDSGVAGKHLNWPLMSIGVANCFGRVIIGFLAARFKVRENQDIH